MTILLYDLVGRDAARPFSPHCWKTRMALVHKRLGFETVPTRFLDVPLVENGASKTVPVIRDGGRVVADSFTIALYLDEAYPERPTLFGGEGGQAMARFVERWSQLTIHPFLLKPLILATHAMQDEANGRYFRDNREARLKMPLERVGDGAEAGLPAFRLALEPLRSMLSFQPWICGEGPLFADYIVFGAFQYARVVAPFAFLGPNDPIADWFERCLALHGGIGRSVPAAG